MKNILPPDTVELKSIEIKLKKLERQESRLLWLSCASILLALTLLLVYKNELTEEPIKKESPKLELQADHNNV